MDSLIIRRTHRVPLPLGEHGESSAVAVQLDAVLLSAGFKLSAPLFGRMATLPTATAFDTALQVIAAVRELVGDHVQHNVYFRDFPAGVPDTVEFWMECLARSVGRTVAASALRGLGGPVDLLALATYGRYQHTYAELLAAHEELIPALTDRVTVLHLGGTLDEEAHDLYRRLGGSTVPLGEADLAALEVLAAWCVAGEQPETIPVRENRAVINRVRLAHHMPLLVDTVTDVLRLACAASGGDVSLQIPTRFRSPARRDRATLLAALNQLVDAAPGKLGDVGRYREQWKRLGERLHPHEYPRYPHAAKVFAAARGELPVKSFAAQVEEAFRRRVHTLAVRLLRQAPGLYLRSLDRLLRSGGHTSYMLSGLEDTVTGVSGRVLCSAREHFQNRGTEGGPRVFANRGRRAWITGDHRPPLDYDTQTQVLDCLDRAVQQRLPRPARLVVDPAVLDLALPLSGKNTEAGFGVLPRGSISPVGNGHLRFFTYWREKAQRTDFDLSVLLLGDGFRPLGHLSWTSLHGFGGVHSGDIVEAPCGATEMIDLDLARVDARYIVPQVHVYSGEGFEEVAESFFGFMVRDTSQAGMPFEPSTVRVKSDLRGPGRVALPLAFTRCEDGTWSAKWMHLYLNGSPQFNMVEGNHVTTGVLARGIMDREYLPVSWLLNLMAPPSGVETWVSGMDLSGPVTWVGLERPEGLPEGSEVYTVDRLRDLIPA